MENLDSCLWALGMKDLVFFFFLNRSFELDVGEMVVSDCSLWQQSMIAKHE